MNEINQPLDIYNPAEFYAALGLLTVLSLQHPGNTLLSHFEISGHEGEDNAALVVSSPTELRLLTTMDNLENAKVSADESANVWRNSDEKPLLVTPVILSCNDWAITLDWWLDDLRYESNGLKFWSGNSNPVDMLKFFIKQWTGSVRAGGTVFGLDTGNSRDAIAVGYSRKDVREKAILRPRIELLCAIGLQRYRPRTLTYYAWQAPITLSITHAAAIQKIVGLPQSAYEFSVRKIGQGAKEATRAIVKNSIDSTTKSKGAQYA